MKVVLLFVMFAGCHNDKFETSKEHEALSTKSGLEQESWDYPIKPGSDEWRETSYDYKVEKSQPPKNLLKNWDTETLFKYCVDYPFNKVTLLYNNPNDGFRRAYEQSSVWQEFIQRKDAFEKFEYFFEVRPYNQLFEMISIEERNDELFILFFLEKLVSETDFSKNLDISGRKKIAKTVLQSHLNKKEYPEEFIGFHYNSSLAALLKILEGNSTNNQISLQNFRQKTNNERFVDESVDTEIIGEVFNFLNK